MFSVVAWMLFTVADQRAVFWGDPRPAPPAGTSSMTLNTWHTYMVAFEDAVARGAVDDQNVETWIRYTWDDQRALVLGLARPPRPGSPDDPPLTTAWGPYIAFFTRWLLPANAPIIPAFPLP